MNCKQGDLAIVVRSKAGHEGKIFRCVSYVGKARGFFGDDYWEIDAIVLSIDGKPNSFFRDSWMRPIRDNDGEDEMLRIVGKPEGVTA